MRHLTLWAATFVVAIGCQAPESSDDVREIPDAEFTPSTEDEPLPEPGSVSIPADEVEVDVEPKAPDALVIHSGPLNTFVAEPNVKYGAGDVVDFPVVTLVNPTDEAITVSTLPLTTWVALGDERFEKNGFAPYIEHCTLVDAYGGNEVSQPLAANDDFKMVFTIETPLNLASAYVDAGVPMITSSQLRARCQFRQDLVLEQRVRLAFEVPMGDPDFQTSASSVSVANHNDLPMAARYVELALPSSGCPQYWYDDAEVAPGQYYVTSRPLLTTNPRNSHTNSFHDGGLLFDVNVNGCGQGLDVKAVRVELQCDTCNLNTTYRMTTPSDARWVRPMWDLRADRAWFAEYGLGDHLLGRRVRCPELEEVLPRRLGCRYGSPGRS